MVKIALAGIILAIGVLGALFLPQQNQNKNSEIVALRQINENQKSNKSNIKHQILEIKNPIKWVEKSDIINIFNITDISNKPNKPNKSDNLDKPNETSKTDKIDNVNNSDKNKIAKVKLSPPIAVGAYKKNDIEYLISEVRKIGKTQGKSDSDLEMMEKSIREIAATTTDLMAEFYKVAKIEPAKSQFINGLNFEWLLGKLLATFGIIKSVDAGLGVHFGGRVVSALPCTCTGGSVWLIALQPLSPSFATLLSYAIGTQLKAAYNITHSLQNIMGFYAPGVQLCWQAGTPCWLIPTWGHISPMVGSSL